jgi:hypothetical protein
MLPIYKYGNFRVIYSAPNQYISRRVSTYSYAQVGILLGRGRDLVDENELDEAFLVFAKIARLFPKTPEADFAEKQIQLIQKLNRTE